MHSGFDIPGIQQHHQQQVGDNSCVPALLPMNQPHILDQIHHHSLPSSSSTQQLFLDHHHFFPSHQHHHQTRLSHHYVAGATASPPYFPAVNFKLGLNEICSEQYVMPQARHSLGMLECWQNQQDSDSSHKHHHHHQQQPFWEPLPSEVSNENSEIVDRQDHMELSQNEEAIANCLDANGKGGRLHFGELEAIYKRLGTTESIGNPVYTQMPNYGSDASMAEEEEEEASPSLEENARKKRRKKKKRGSCSQMISPMAEFFENMVKEMIDHQENLHTKFTEMIERLDEERRAREEAWRNQELAHFRHEAEARARDKANAENREAMIVSYLEKITGHKLNFHPTQGE